MQQKGILELRELNRNYLNSSLAASNSQGLIHLEGLEKILFGTPFLRTIIQDYKYKFRHCKVNSKQQVCSPFCLLSRDEGCFQERKMMTSSQFIVNLLVTDLLASKPMAFVNRRVTVFGMLFQRINLVLWDCCGTKTWKLDFYGMSLGKMSH